MMRLRKTIMRLRDREPTWLEKLLVDSRRATLRAHILRYGSKTGNAPGNRHLGGSSVRHLGGVVPNDPVLNYQPVAYERALYIVSPIDVQGYLDEYPDPPKSNLGFLPYRKAHYKYPKKNHG